MKAPAAADAGDDETETDGDDAGDQEVVIFAVQLIGTGYDVRLVDDAQQDAADDEEDADEAEDEAGNQRRRDARPEAAVAELDAKQLLDASLAAHACVVS